MSSWNSTFRFGKERKTILKEDLGFLVNSYFESGGSIKEVESVENLPKESLHANWMRINGRNRKTYIKDDCKAYKLLKIMGY